MDGFKPVVKMKSGGSVSKAVEKCGGGRMKAGGKVMHDDIKEDKKLIKKAVNLHDDQLHEGKKTDLSTLKKGGRAKKETGTVRKYKCGGEVKKMADGGLSDMVTASQAAGSPNTMPQNAAMAEVLRRKKLAQLGAPAAAPAAPVGQPTPQNIGATTGPIMKRGGKVKK